MEKSLVEYARWLEQRGIGVAKKPTAVNKKTNKNDMEDEITQRAKAYATQSPTPEPLKPAISESDQSTGESSIDRAFAQRVLACWNTSPQAQKDFHTVTEFHSFCEYARSKDAKLPPHLRERGGVEYYERLRNLERGRGKR